MHWLIFFLILFISQVANAATCHVGSGQTHATIQAGVNACTAAGDIVSIHTGTYTESVNAAAGGSTGNPIRIQSANYTGDGCDTPGCGSGDSVTWSGGSNNEALNIVDLSHVRVQGITFANTNTSTDNSDNAVIFAYNSTCWFGGVPSGCKDTPIEGIEILNNTFDSNGHDGSSNDIQSTQIRLYYLGRITGSGAVTTNVSGNTFTGNYGEGITAGGTSDIRIANNVMTNQTGAINPSLTNGSPPFWYHGGLMNVFGVCGTICTPSDRFLIEGNDVGGLTAPSTPHEMTAVRFDACKDSSGVVIQDNILHDYTDHTWSIGIFMEANCHFDFIRRNIIYGTMGQGIAIGRGDDVGSNGGSIEHNTIRTTGESAIHFYTSTGTTTKNNIFVQLRSGSQVIGVENTATSGNTFLNNLYYNPNQSGIGDWNESDYTWGAGSQNLASWSSSSGDTGSQVANPLFTNPGAADFTLQSGSPARDAADDATDQGAIQFTAVTEDLIAHWEMNIGSGTNVIDSSGNGLTGERCNVTTCPSASGPAWVTGKVGSNALSFNGTSQYVQVPANSLFNVTGDITIAMWVNRDSIGAAQGLFAKTNGTLWDYVWYFESTNVLCFYSDATTPTGVCGVVALTDITLWHHLTVTRVGSTLTFYIDGVAGASLTLTGAFSAGSYPVYLGQDTNVFVAGSMDDVRLYNYALDQTEINALVALGADAVAPAAPTNLRVVGP